jgi:hypothetical protein
MQTAPAIDLSTIPAAQRAAVLALMETVAALTEITRRQEHLIAELNHALHGKRSEKLSEDERQLAFEDLSIALAEVEAEKETRAAKASDGAARPAPKRTIGNLPATLPRLEEVIEPESLICPLRLRRHAQDRRRPFGAAGHRACAAARHRHRATEICLPVLHRWGDPSPCAPAI